MTRPFHTTPPLEGPLMPTRTPQLQIITRALRNLIPGAQLANMSVTVTETLSDGRAVNTWTGSPFGVADRVHAALYGMPAPAPLQTAEDCKRARNIPGEIHVLSHAHAALTTAPWYPARRGDLLHIHYEASEASPAGGETYLVEPAAEDQALLQLRLLTHTLDEDMAGCYAPGDACDPLYEPWFEAGPGRLTLVRDGRVVHGGGAR